MWKGRGPQVARTASCGCGRWHCQALSPVRLRLPVSLPDIRNLSVAIRKRINRPHEGPVPVWNEHLVPLAMPYSPGVQAAEVRQMDPAFAKTAWLTQGRDKVIELFAQHRTALDLDCVDTGVRKNGKLLREAWESFMQEVLDKGLAIPGTQVPLVQTLIRNQRKVYKGKAEKIRNGEPGVTWTEADRAHIEVCFGPLPHFAGDWCATHLSCILSHSRISSDHAVMGTVRQCSCL
jgi:hypothetical protein